MRQVSELRLIRRPIARIRHRKKRRDGERGGRAIQFKPRNHHARNPRINRHFCHFLAYATEATVPIRGPNFNQRALALFNLARARRIKKRKCGWLTQTQITHAQDNASQRSTFNFWRRRDGARLKILRASKAHAHTSGHATRATTTLLQ